MNIVIKLLRLLKCIIDNVFNCILFYWSLYFGSNFIHLENSIDTLGLSRFKATKLVRQSGIHGIFLQFCPIQELVVATIKDQVPEECAAVITKVDCKEAHPPRNL